LRLASEDPPYKNLNHLSLQDPTLREAIAVFNTGRFQQLLNGTDNQLAHSNVMGFEMSSLVKANHQERDLNISVIKAIFNELEELFKDRQPTLLILEEAWLYLRHSLFFEKLTDWFKTLRKYNVSVIFISQDVADIVNSGAASVIQGSCMTRIFLPNASANENAVSEHYKAFGLNERQIEILRRATPKQDYYYQSRLGNRLFNLDLGELAKAFMCVSDKADMKQFDEVYKNGGSNWVIDWLQYKSLSEWGEFVRDQYIVSAGEII
jgi:type IV secretion system protein TrbE